MNRKKDSEILARRALQVQRGAARASVLGVNDGLVSTLCLVLAVAGAGASTQSVLLAGFAGLVAGAVSMAAGEWISVTAQVDLFTGVIKDVKKLARTDRELLVEQMSTSLETAGYSKGTADTASEEIGQNNDYLTDAYTRQVMGFNPDELGSPWLAAISSFVLFAVGALAPLAPWFFGGGAFAVWLSIVFTAVGSLVVGGYISYSSGNGVMRGALRQLGIVALASVVTYGIGYMFGIAVG
jgi:VIT1/CCC1 family predicted Fe2+/Mn2+ transporter